MRFYAIGLMLSGLLLSSMVQGAVIENETVAMSPQASSTAKVKNTSKSSSKNKFDRLLLDMDLVDDNYVYSDIDLVSSFFKLATKYMSNKENFIKKTKIKKTKELRFLKATIAPYEFNFEFKFNNFLSKDSKDQIAYAFNKPEALKDACNQFYFDEQFKQANNVKTIFSIYDENKQLITKMVLDKQTCLHQ